MKKRKLAYISVVLCVVLSWVIAWQLDGRQFSMSYFQLLIKDVYQNIISRPQELPSRKQQLDTKKIISAGGLGDHGDIFQCTNDELGGIGDEQKSLIFKWKDNEGQVHYGDKAPKGELAEIVRNEGIEKDFFDLNVMFPSGFVTNDFKTPLEIGGKAIYKTIAEYLSLESLYKSKIDIKIFSSKNAYDRFRERIAPNVKATAAGFYSGRYNVAVVLYMNSEESKRVALHEAAHVINAQNFGNTPKWFNEGLAEYFQQIKVREQYSQALINQHWLKEVGGRYQIMSLKRLFSTDPEDWQVKDNSYLYANSWALVYFLMLPVNKPYMQGYMVEMNKNKCLAADAYHWFNGHYPGGVRVLESNYLEWLKSEKKKLSQRKV